MILLSELSRRRIRSIQKLIRVGRNEVVVVLRVDKEKGLACSSPPNPTNQLCTRTRTRTYIHWGTKGYIDLSKRRVSPEDITKCEERFMKARTVSSIMRHVASRLPTFDPATEGGGVSTAAPAATESKKGLEKEGDAAADEVAPPPPPPPAAGPSEEERLEKLYEHIAWPLGRKYGNMYDAFKLALTQVFFFFFTSSLFISPVYLYLFFFCRGAESQMLSLRRFHNLFHKRRITS